MSSQAKRMLAEAQSRLHDADLLSQSGSCANDSDALLRILGFELLLKAALVVRGIKPPRHHRYDQLWNQLPADDQATILVSAKSRMPGLADLSDLHGILRWYRFVFEKARYHYELYEGYTPEEMHELGELWRALGSPNHEAVVQYHPEELICLIHGLEQFVGSAA